MDEARNLEATTAATVMGEPATCTVGHCHSEDFTAGPPRLHEDLIAGDQILLDTQAPELRSRAMLCGLSQSRVLARR